MKRIDIYIIKKFLGTFFYVALLFTLISTIIDFSGISSRFLESEASGYSLLFDYYLNFIPWINSILWPIFILISVIFFTSRLASNSEILAILNAGVSYIRFLTPYIAVAVFLFVLHLLGNHFIVPRANKIKFGFENTYIWKSNDKGKYRDVHFFLDADTKVYVRYYNKKDSSARDVRIETFFNGQIVEVLHAKNMDWVSPPHVWRLEDYIVHTFSGLRESLGIYEKESLDTSIAIHPEDFVKFVNEKDWLTSPEILEIIEEETESGRANTRNLETEYYRRTADSFSIIVLTLIGVSVASRKTRGGMGFHLAIGVIIGALYIFLLRFSILLSINSNIHPGVAVWIPNIVFSIVTFYFLSKAQK